MKTPEEWQRELDGALEADCEHRPAFLCTPCERECFRRIIAAAQREVLEAAAKVAETELARTINQPHVEACAATAMKITERIRALLPPVAP